MIDLFLWVCPLVGGGIFVAGFLRGDAPVPVGGSGDERFFRFPGTGLIALLAIATLVPLCIAFMTRRTLGFLAGVSLVVLVTAELAWLESRHAWDRVFIAWTDEATSQGSHHQWTMDSRGGKLSLVCQQWLPPVSPYYFRVPDGNIGWQTNDPIEQDLADRIVDNGGVSHVLHLLGLQVAIKPAWDSNHGGVTLKMMVPYWFLCLLATPFPLAWFIRQRRHRRVQRRAKVGACIVCGYDLRATPDADGARLAVCPECGGRGG
jgi:hypothetical protein